GGTSLGPEEPAGLRRKRAVLAVLLHFLDTYKGLLQEEESAGRVVKELYLLIMKDTSLYHELEDEVLRLHQLVESVELKCKQNQDMLSFYAVVIGLNNAAISRLRLTWEKLPGKFKNLFRKFENLTDPCRNHKSYREVLAKMKPPLIPFVPLILKDLTFLHEGSKTLLDGLVNMEKLVRAWPGWSPLRGVGVP
ncbi:PREDICTED: rap guanine nucleotide exchange factor-like 1, partial [Tinamus guttatus]|uniref:rap guanine nucleotide exchange factor-like 1 n=1 Tax=Tinamus guttatus TaxID=94827 RepID=UPI00052F31CF